ncbi:MAG: helix-turn-helix transcriptional regulator [Candidatus Levybacteria bacterium]|nr:helix-turn-helix transcriptional regulator [Candidatus Levybacteria bacterium]
MQLPKNLPLQGDLYNQRCPARDISKHISSLWGLTVLRLLKDNSTLRFSGLKASIEGISDRMLSQTLRNLERDGMLQRQDYKLTPPKVEYSLTQLGNECADRLIPLCEFIEDNMNVVVLNQMKYDESPTVAEWQLVK